MSVRGIQATAAIFSQVQNVKVNLMSGDKQDVMLGQLLNRMNDAVKDDFAKIVSATPKSKKS